MDSNLRVEIHTATRTERNNAKYWAELIADAAALASVKKFRFYPRRFRFIFVDIDLEQVGHREIQVYCDCWTGRCDSICDDIHACRPVVEAELRDLYVIEGQEKVMTKATMKILVNIFCALSEYGF